MNTIDSKIKQLGLVETTGKKQKENGTRQFRDPVMGVNYASYPSGYVRRIHDLHNNRIYPTMYPVNSRRDHDPTNPYDVSYVILKDESDRMELMFKAVETYRITRKVQILTLKFPELSNRCLRELAKKNYAYFSKDWEGKSTLESNASR